MDQFIKVWGHSIAFYLLVLPFFAATFWPRRSTRILAACAFAAFLTFILCIEIFDANAADDRFGVFGELLLFGLVAVVTTLGLAVGKLTRLLLNYAFSIDQTAGRFVAAILSVFPCAYVGQMAADGATRSSHWWTYERPPSSECLASIAYVRLGEYEIKVSPRDRISLQLSASHKALTLGHPKDDRLFCKLAELGTKPITAERIDLSTKLDSADLARRRLYVLLSESFRESAGDRHALTTTYREMLRSKDIPNYRQITSSDFYTQSELRDFDGDPVTFDCGRMQSRLDCSTTYWIGPSSSVHASFPSTADSAIKDGLKLVRAVDQTLQAMSALKGAPH